MGVINKLSTRQIASLREPGRYGDGGGLWLQISQWGTRSWVFRFTMHGRPRHMGLGSAETLTLAEARDRARDARKQVLDGKDPIAERRRARDAQRAEDAKRVTFKDAAGRYIDSQSAGWRSAKHGEQWTATLSNYAYPVIGHLPVSDVGTAHVLKILEPIWTAKTETASRLRGRIEAVLDWATARHLRTGDNPARWRGHLSKILPAKTRVAKVSHQAAMPYDDVPAFLAELAGCEFVSARALEFTILTAARTGEVIGALETEIDWQAKVWTIPKERTKAGREHRVPLSSRAIDLLKSVPREKDNPFLFIGGRAGQGLSNMAMLELLRGMDSGKAFTVHGFRSTFRDWAGERTNFPREIAEAALSHVVGDETERAYRRGDALEKRRRLMEAWGRYCSVPAADREKRGDSQVIQLAAAQA